MRGRIGCLMLIVLAVGIVAAAWWSQPRLVVVAESQHCRAWAAGGMTTDGRLLYVLGPVPAARLAKRSRLYIIEPDGAEPWRTLATLDFDAAMAHVTYANQRIYAIGNGLHVVDVSEPSQPKQVGRMDWPVPWTRSPFPGEASLLSETNNVRGLRILGDTAIVQLPDQSVEFVDVSVPETMRWLGRMPLVSGATANDVAVLDHYVYFMDRGLHVVDLSNPASPREIATVTAPEECEVSQALAVDERNRVLYCASFRLWSFDLANPEAPRLVGQAGKASVWRGGLTAIIESEGYHDILLLDDLAFARTQADDMFWPRQLLAFDRRDPAHPRRIGRPRSEGAIGGLTAIGDTVYMSIPAEPKAAPDCQSKLVEMRVALRSGILP